jgi:exodeoxyribonuclease V gamma subunit
MDVIVGISGHKDIHFFNRNIETDQPYEECKLLLENWKEPYEAQDQLLNKLIKESGYKFEEIEIGTRSENLTNIELHSCHGNRREIEVLKDEVLRFLDNHPDAEVSDILILVPDADEYAPLLETHFSEKNTSENQSLPLSRLHRKQSQLNEHSLICLLDLLNSSFKPSSVVDVMSLEPVKTHFEFNDDDIDLIEDWILSNRIYRGMGDTFNGPFSWQKAVNQLIAGAVMAPDYLESFSGLVPVVELSTGDEMALAAKFSSFIHALKNVTEEIETDETPEKWLALVEKMCRELIIDPENENKEPSIFKTLARLKEHIAYSEGKKTVPFSLFRNWLKEQVNTSNSSSSRFGQGITVSTYIPYRSVPFRLIAILGLNEGVFPRRAVRPEFDLIYKEPKTGDRIQSDDDTYLFYEILSSASDHLHISYKGQDLRSEMDRLPSMLVQQLKESLPEDHISLYRHRLHSFSASYFNDENKIQQPKLHRSYNEKQKLVAEQVSSPVDNTFDFKLDQIRSPDVFKVSDLAIGDLINYLTNPTNYMMKSELGINFDLYKNEIQEREMFDLKGLDKYKIDALLYESIQKEIPDSKIFEYASTAGFIPDMLKGKQVFQNEYDKTLELLNEVSELTKQEEKNHELRFTCEGVQVYGSINGLYGKSLVLNRVGQRREMHEIEQWVLHNALLSSGYPINNSYYISFDKNNSIELNRIDTKFIEEHVFKMLLNWFLDDKPILDKLNFFPKTSKIYAEVLRKTDDENKALNKAQTAYTPGRYNKYAEGGEESNRVVWRGIDPVMKRSFKHNAVQFWEPYLKALENSNE